MNTELERLKGETQNQEMQQQLLKYQVDTANGVMTGMFGFMERRNDVGPGIELLAQIAAQLGDAGGGWISP